MENLKQEIKDLIVNGLNLHDIGLNEIGDDTQLFGEGLGLDSLDAMELLVLLKKKYGVEVKNSEEGQQVIATINSLADFVKGAKQ